MPSHDTHPTDTVMAILPPRIVPFTPVNSTNNEAARPLETNRSKIRMVARGVFLNEDHPFKIVKRKINRFGTKIFQANTSKKQNLKREEILSQF